MLSTCVCSLWTLGQTEDYCNCRTEKSESRVRKPSTRSAWSASWANRSWAFNQGLVGRGAVFRVSSLRGLSGLSEFPPFARTNISKFQFDQDRGHACKPAMTEWCRFLFNYCNLKVCSVCSDTVIGIGVEEEDRKHTWMEDANSVSKAEEPSTRFSVYVHTNPQSTFNADLNCPYIFFLFVISRATW